MPSPSLPLVVTRTAFVALVSAVVAWGGAACSSFSENDAAADAGAADSEPPVELDAGEPDAALPETSIAPGAVTVLASGFTGLAGVAATEDQVYFVERSKGVVHAVPLAGGAATAFASAPQLPEPSGLVVSDGFIVWIDASSRMLAHRAIDPGSPSITARDIHESALPRSIAAGMVNGAPRVVVALTDQDDSSDGSVLELGLSGAPPTALGSTIALPFDVAVRGALAVWTDKSHGEVWSSPLDATGATQVAVDELACESIAIDAEGIYWALPAVGAIRMAGPTPPAMTNAGVVKPLAAAESKPYALAADDSGVYWLTEDGKLRRSTRSELPPQTIASGFASVFTDRRVQAIALTSKYVVWITSDGKVLRHAK